MHFFCSVKEVQRLAFPAHTECAWGRQRPRVLPRAAAVASVLPSEVAEGALVFISEHSLASKEVSRRSSTP